MGGLRLCLGCKTQSHFLCGIRAAWGPFGYVHFGIVLLIAIAVSEKVHAGPWKVELQTGSLASNGLGIQINLGRYIDI